MHNLCSFCSFLIWTTSSFPQYDQLGPVYSWTAITTPLLPTTAVFTPTIDQHKKPQDSIELSKAKSSKTIVFILLHASSIHTYLYDFFRSWSQNVGNLHAYLFDSFFLTHFQSLKLLQITKKNHSVRLTAITDTYNLYEGNKAKIRFWLHFCNHSLKICSLYVHAAYFFSN